MNKILMETLKRHGPIAVIAVLLGFLVMWQAKSGAEERKNLFDTQMEYIMDMRVTLGKTEVRLEQIERNCQPARRTSRGTTKPPGP